MAYIAKDGKRFPNSQSGRKYDAHLAEAQDNATVAGERVRNAPGGPRHLDAVHSHGRVISAKYEEDGPGRFRVTTRHADGHSFSQVSPDRERAVQMIGDMTGAEHPPSGLVHARAKAHPTGPKEHERIADEDQREHERAD